MRHLSNAHHHSSRSNFYEAAEKFFNELWPMLFQKRDVMGSSFAVAAMSAMTDEKTQTRRQISLSGKYVGPEGKWLVF